MQIKIACNSETVEWIRFYSNFACGIIEVSIVLRIKCIVAIATLIFFVAMVFMENIDYIKLYHWPKCDTKMLSMRALGVK